MTIKKEKNNNDGLTLHSVVIKNTVPLTEAKQIAADIIKNPNRKFYRVDTNSYRFRNLPKGRFVPDSFRGKIINENVSLMFGILKTN